MRQFGAAIGTAAVGAVLALGLAMSLEPALTRADVVPDPVAHELATATRASVGGMIVSLREEGTDGRLGHVGPTVVAALADGFTDAILADAAFLVLGVAGATRVVANARRRRLTGHATITHLPCRHGRGLRAPTSDAMRAGRLRSDGQR